MFGEFGKSLTYQCTCHIHILIVSTIAKPAINFTAGGSFVGFSYSLCVGIYSSLLYFRDIWISPVVIFHTAHGKISPTFPHKCFLCLVIDIYLEIFTDILPIIPNEIRGVIPAFSSMNIIVYPDLETIRHIFHFVHTFSTCFTTSVPFPKFFFCFEDRNFIASAIRPPKAFPIATDIHDMVFLQSKVIYKPIVMLNLFMEHCRRDGIAFTD